jgi:hypothetical protein
MMIEPNYGAAGILHRRHILLQVPELAGAEVRGSRAACVWNCWGTLALI